jgi:hypothetical protein
MTRKLNSRETWQAIVDFAADADVDAVAEMSEAEVDAELAKAGFDLAEENREAKAEHEASVDAAMRETRRDRPLVKPPRRPRANPWLSAPAGFLVAIGSLLLLGETAVMVGNGTKADAGLEDAGDAGVDGGGSRAPR